MVFVFLPNEVQMRNASFWLSTLYKCKHLEPLKQIHSSLIITGLIHDLFVAGKLLLHSTFSLHHASLILQHSPSPDVFMYNTLIRAFSESNHPQKALALYAHMRTKLLPFPDSFSFAFALKAAASFASYEAGIQLHCQAFVCGFCHHLFVGTTLVSMYGECGFFECSQKVFDEMPERNVVAWNAVVNACFRSGDLSLARMLFDSMPCRDLTSWNVALMGYVKGGQLERAMGIFREMPVKDNVSWSTLIVGFAHNGCFDEAFGRFRELIREGARLSEVSLSAVLSACAQSGAFEFGKILHGFIEKAGFAHVLSVNNALLDTYAKCGHVRMAQFVFWGISEKKSIVSWTSMMAGLAMHGHGEEAIKLFHEMEDSGIRPDRIAFISLLYACSHAGLVKQGCSYFDRMRKVYCLEPEIEHYGCMVDLYGRSGQLQKAYEFVCQMPIPPNAVIWRTLLGACSIHGNVKLAEIVKERLSLLDPNNSGDHVLLSNVYAVAGKWTDVADVRRTMTDNRVKKTPGWSIIEVDKIIYTFVAGANVDKITEEAYEKLKEIMCRLRIEGGYIPEVRNVLYDIDEEEKEDSVTRHSEKLAVAFGIARLRKRKTITIVKNLRICRDCHAVLKLISKVYKLEIVVRDRSRFHSFTLGFCSCRDYW